MSELRGELAAAERSRLLRCIATAIHGFTVMARDPDLSAQETAAIDNRVHYLAGHLMALIDTQERLTESRLDGIVELVSRLNGRSAEQTNVELTRRSRRAGGPSASPGSSDYPS